MSWRLEFLKLTVPELVRKFYTFCGTRMFITVVTTACFFSVL